jgi:gliding motility-associated-like protein
MTFKKMCYLLFLKLRFMRVDRSIRSFLLPFMLAFMPAWTYAKSGHGHGAEHDHAHNKRVKELQFEENKGQWDQRALFKADLRGGRLFLEKGALTYTFYNPADLDRIHAKRHQPGSDVSSEIINNHAFRVHFEGATGQAFVRGTGLKQGYHNYFIGNDPSKWASDVRLFEKVQYTGLYPSVDLDVYSYKGNLKYDLIVNPGGSANDIVMRYEGPDALALREGSLIIKTSVNDIVEQKPYAYQLINGKRVTIECRFVLKNNTVRFAFPRGYDTGFPLVIDPIVVASTYSGSSADTWGHCATYDAGGNIYSGGLAFGQGYPVTAGAYQTTFGGVSDAAIAKLDPQGSSFFYATFVGGSNGDFPQSMFVNANNEVYVYGNTQSTNFPTVAGSYSTAFNGGTTDIYIFRLSATGNALLGSTFVGGNQNDGNNGISFNYGDTYRGEIILDASSNVYIASFTSSVNFPTTAGAYDVTHNGLQDGVVFKLNSTLTSLQWSTFLGGSQNDGAYGLRLDAIGNVYATGVTSSSGFPTTAGTVYTTYQGGGFDGFVAYLVNNGTGLGSSTFFGTALSDLSYFMDIDMNGDIYIYGVTQGLITPSAGVYSNPGSGQFIVKLDPGLNNILWRTVFGDGTPVTPYMGGNEFSPTAFMVDICGNIYASGWGSTLGFPVSSNAVQSTNDGNDFYLLVLDQNAASMTYATYYGDSFGWEHVDGGTSRFDKNGIVYQAVCACGGNFPTTANAVAPTTPSWNCDIAVFKIDFQAVGVIATAVASPTSTGCAPFTISFNNQSSGAINYVWDFGDGSPIDTATAPTHTFVNPGTYNVMLIAIDSLSCNFSDTTYLTVTVNTTPVVNLGNDTTICGSFTMPLNAGNPGATYQWSTSATSQTINVNATGTYWVQVSNGTCTDVDSITVTAPAPAALGSDTTLCSGQSLTLSSSTSAASYLWSTGATTQTITVSTSGSYWVEATTGSCISTDTINVTFSPAPSVNLGADTTICTGPFTLNAANPGASYQWSTGATTQTIAVTTAGTYWVQANIGSCSDIDSIVISIPPPLALGSDTVLCEGQPLTLTAPQATSYQWSTGATSQSINVTASNTYWVEANSNNCITSDTIVVTFNPIPAVNMGADTTICNGTLTLDAGNPGASYLWSTGSTSQTINVSLPGSYSVTVTNNGCTGSDNIAVTFAPPVSLGEDINVCDASAVTLSVGDNGTAWLWSTGETTPAIEVEQDGVYWVEVSYGSCRHTDTIEVTGASTGNTLYFPNSFTPNADGLNETFKGYGTDIEEFNMQIFNRWGELFFETSDMNTGWNGFYKGKLVQVDVYVYVVTYKTRCSGKRPIRKVGHVMVNR